MFERFTEKAIKVIMLAQEEARRLGHNFVGTEQVLLGLIGEGTGVAAKTLKAMGLNLKDARAKWKRLSDAARICSCLNSFTPRAKRGFGTILGRSETTSDINISDRTPFSA
jgi:ATP-dependent Clp protease ATP-binding subunit ClpC